MCIKCFSEFGNSMILFVSEVEFFKCSNDMYDILINTIGGNSYCLCNLLSVEDLSHIVEGIADDKLVNIRFRRK